MMSTLSDQILIFARSLPKGSIVTAKDFLHLAQRAAIDQTLSRLSKDGKLVRVGRGLYVVPVSSRFGTYPPSAKSVIRAYEASSGNTIVPSGAAEANALGVSTQVPMGEVFLTSGPSRKFQLGNLHIELIHGKRWELALGKRPAGMAVRAIGWLGPNFASSSVKQVRSKLPKEEWNALWAARSAFPEWMARAISEAV